MLITQKNILECNPPYVMELSNNTWQLVEQITLIEERYSLTIIEKDDEKISKRIIYLDETPFHVGEEVWELNYGSTLMTLNHKSLDGHPAKQVWQEYLTSNK